MRYGGQRVWSTWAWLGLASLTILGWVDHQRSAILHSNMINSSMLDRTGYSNMPSEHHVIPIWTYTILLTATRVDHGFDLLNSARLSDHTFMEWSWYIINSSMPDRPVQSKLSSYHLFGPELGIVCDPIIAHDHARSNMHHPHGVEWSGGVYTVMHWASSRQC